MRPVSASVLSSRKFDQNSKPQSINSSFKNQNHQSSQTNNIGYSKALKVY